MRHPKGGKDTSFTKRSAVSVTVDRTNIEEWREVTRKRGGRKWRRKCKGENEGDVHTDIKLPLIRGLSCTPPHPFSIYEPATTYQL